MAGLSCVFKRTGASSFEQSEHSVPADFGDAHSIRCPIPRVNYADDGAAASARIFFSASNDGEIYRYSNHTVLYHGHCQRGSFMTKLFALLGVLLTVLVTVGLPVLLILAAVSLGAEARVRSCFDCFGIKKVAPYPYRDATPLRVTFHILSEVLEKGKTAYAERRASRVGEQAHQAPADEPPQWWDFICGVAPRKRRPPREEML